MYKICEKCGSTLDPAETCDCEKNYLAVQTQRPLIVLSQLPVITARLQEIAASIQSKVEQADALVVTADSKQAAKTLKATLNKEREQYEEVRVRIKSEILEPYNYFYREYDRIVKSQYDSAEETLKTKIDDIENEEIAKKLEAVREYFNEYRDSLRLDFVEFGRAGIKVNLTASLVSLKKAGKKWLDQIASDVALIETQEHKEEILVEYKQTLDVSRAIVTVTERHKAIESEQRRAERQASAKEAEVEAVKRVERIAPPVAFSSAPVDDAPRTLTFKVTAPLSKLRELKKFLINGGYLYE